jgi:hypothetical protein
MPRLFNNFSYCFLAFGSFQSVPTALGKTNVEMTDVFRKDSFVSSTKNDKLHT